MEFYEITLNIFLQKNLTVPLLSVSMSYRLWVQ